MRDIGAGMLDTKVLLGRPVVTRDDAGGEVLVWEELETWANLAPLTGREWSSGDAVKDNVDAKVTLRLNPDWIPSARWRVVDPRYGRTYNLVTAMLIPQKGAVECLAKTVQGNADGR